MQIFIPDDFAHGFQSLQDDSTIIYKATNVHSKEHECTIMWNDPLLNIKWPISNPIISQKDLHTGIKLSKL
jgi:dTDP-4-dehydrorhamnose 3,5-epimerase